MSKKAEEEGIDNEEYQSLIVSLIYLTNTRPDIENSVNILAKFVSNPSKTHFLAGKWILRYLQGTKLHGHIHRREKNETLDWVL